MRQRELDNLRFIALWSRFVGLNFLFVLINYLLKIFQVKKKANSFKPAFIEIKNYNLPPTSVPANLSTSILCSGANVCAADVKALITPNRLESGST